MAMNNYKLKQWLWRVIRSWFKTTKQIRATTKFIENSYQLKKLLWKWIRSCETKEQIRTAERLVENYAQNCNADKSEVEIMKMFLSNQEVFINVA